MVSGDPAPDPGSPRIPEMPVVLQRGHTEDISTPCHIAGGDDRLLLLRSNFSPPDRRRGRHPCPPCCPLA
jgi:hypothetical protein